MVVVRELSVALLDVGKLQLQQPSGALKMLVALSEKLSIGYSLPLRVGLTFGGRLLIGFLMQISHMPIWAPGFAKASAS